MERELDVAQVAFDEQGLVPVVAQDAGDGAVLMLAWANEAALRRTLESGQAHYWSRSRGELWRKGATSGHTQRVRSVRLDCDGDAVLYGVEQTGPACHTGRRSCFHRAVDGGLAPVAAPDEDAPDAMLALLQEVVDDRLARRPAGSYVTRLHERGRGYVAQKVIEEAGEVVVAALEGNATELPAEAADLLFHLTVLLRESGSGLDAVARVLAERHRERTDGAAPPS